MEQQNYDALKARKQKADSIYATNAKIPLINVKNYVNICEKMYAIESFEAEKKHLVEMCKFFCMTAPETLNPAEIKEHLGYVQAYLSEKATLPASADYVAKGNQFFLSFHPMKVDEYKNVVRKYLNGFYATYIKDRENENKNKKEEV